MGAFECDSKQQMKTLLQSEGIWYNMYYNKVYCEVFAQKGGHYGRQKSDSQEDKTESYTNHCRCVCGNYFKWQLAADVAGGIP